MIRYPITDEKLRDRINVAVPSWFQRAGQRTAALEALGRYSESSSIWGEVKEVYVRLQHSKCGFCERRLADPRRGSIEHDLEHFRPKSEVKGWPTKQIQVQRGLKYDFPTGSAHPTGYYRLAYHPWNYLAACKPCNTILKSSFFPVEADRIAAEDAVDPWQMQTEQAFLVYPIGDLDEDPENILTFTGNLPLPKHTAGPLHRRARVVIDFFELDTREDLLEDRATWILVLWTALRLHATGTAADRAIAQARIREYVSPIAPHANCVRTFFRLARQDLAAAEEIALRMSDYLASKRTLDAFVE